MKNLKFFAGRIVLLLIVSMMCSCVPSEKSRSSKDSISVTKCLSPYGGKGTASFGIIFDPNVAYYYEDICKPLQNAGMRCVFYCPLRSFEIYVSGKMPQSWKNFKKYTDAGHLIGIDIAPDNLFEGKPEELLKRIDTVADAFFQKTGYRISALRIHPMGIYPFKINILLSKKYILDDGTSFLHTFAPQNYVPDYRDVADEAVLGERWAKYYIERIDKNVLADVIAELKEHTIDVVPYPEMVLYRKALFSASCSVKKEKAGRNYNLTVSGKCAEYPNVPVCYRVLQYHDSTVVKEDCVSLLDHESKHISLKSSFDNIKSFSAPQLTVFPRDAQASLVFTIDDFNASQIKEWYPVLRKYGLVATHFFQMNHGGIPSAFEDLKKMEENGHEIGCHSYVHHIWKKDEKKMIFVGMFPVERFEDDLNKALEVINRMGLHCTAYCYPANFHRYPIRQIVKKHFPFMVLDERVVFSPKRMEFDSDSYLDLLQQEHCNHIQMLHLPFYGNEKILAAFEPVFAAVSKNPKIMNWTFSQMQAYWRARAETSVIFYKADNHEIRFSVGSKNDSPIPCLLPMTCKLSTDPETIASVCTENGKNIPWKSANNCILFDVERGQNVHIRFR